MALYLPATANIENTEDLRQPGWKNFRITSSSDDPLGALDQLVTASNYVCPSKAVADSLQQKRQKVWRYSLLNTAMVKCHMQKARITD